MTSSSKSILSFVGFYILGLFIFTSIWGIGKLITILLMHIK